MNDIEATIAALKPDVATPGDAARSLAEQRLDELIRTHHIPGERTTLRRHSRLVFAVCAALVLMTGVAVAAGPRIASELRIFDEPAKTPTSKAGQDRAEMWTDILDTAPEGSGLGVAEPGRSRVLLKEDVDGFSIEIVATPTSTSRICVQSIIKHPSWPSPGGGGGCIEGFAEHWPLRTMVQSGGLGRPIVFGMTPDGVSKVMMVTSAGQIEALLGDHAYLWVGKPGERLTGIVVEMTDGTQLRQMLPKPLPPHKTECKVAVGTELVSCAQYAREAQQRRNARP